ncbi:hypothetical protein ACYOEI_18920, partial [Singulisphaera rosea]
SAGSPFPGRSLARFWDPSRRNLHEATEPIVSEVSLQSHDAHHHAEGQVDSSLSASKVSLLDQGKLYIHAIDGREELYDLADDPDEAKNLAGKAESRADLERCRAAFAGLAEGTTH